MAGVLQSMGSQRVGHDWATELTDYYIKHLGPQGSAKCSRFFSGTE